MALIKVLLIITPCADTTSGMGMPSLPQLYVPEPPYHVGSVRGFSSSGYPSVFHLSFLPTFIVRKKYSKSDIMPSFAFNWYKS